MRRRQMLADGDFRRQFSSSFKAINESKLLITIHFECRTLRREVEATATVGFEPFPALNAFDSALRPRYPASYIAEATHNSPNTA